MIIYIAFAVEIVLFVIMYNKCKNMYPNLDDLDEKEFRLKKILPIGLYILQDLLKYSFDKPRDLVTQNKLSQLHGPKQSGVYLRLTRANQVSIIILGILVVTFFAAASQLSETMDNEAEVSNISISGNKVERPAYGEGSEPAALRATYQSGEEQVSVDYYLTISEQIPDDEQCIEDLAKTLETYILNGNEDAQHITGDMVLPNKSSKLDVKMEWSSSDPEVINEEGTVTRSAKANKEVTLTAILKKNDIEKKYDYKVTVIKAAPLTDAQSVALAKGEMDQKLEEVNQNKEAATVNLPAQIGNTTVSWEKIEQGSSKTVSILVFGLVVIFLLAFLADRTLDENIKKKQRLIFIDYPEFLNKITILINSGMNVQKTLEKISSDYLEKAEKTGTRRPLYEELSVAVMEMSGGKIFSDAMNDFAMRCKTREILKFVSILELNNKKGSGELVATLKIQSAEAWEMRKASAKRQGEEASTKLLLPLGIMLIAVLLIVITPAALSLTGM